MGMHADDYTNMCIDHEAEWDDYFSGNMSLEDAYDKGIMNAQGYADAAQLDRVIERNNIGTFDQLNADLKDALKDLNLSNQTHNSYGCMKSALNQQAIKNLSKPHPTCNYCGEQMKARNGKYGKFYYCHCPEQCTVSDKYWQSIRR